MSEIEETITDEGFYSQSLSIWDGEEEVIFDIFTAASLGNWSCLGERLEKEKSLINSKNHSGWTALMYAGFYGHNDVVRELINFGASVHSQNNKGETALMLVATCGNIGIISTLLKAGSKLEDKDNSHWTALYHAVYWSQSSTVQILLQQQANPNVMELMTGKTPLMCAVELSNAGLVLTLLECGANPCMICNNGHNALWYAQQSQCHPIIHILSQFMIKGNMHTPIPKSNKLLHVNMLNNDNTTAALPSSPQQLNKEVTPSDLPSLLKHLDLSSYIPVFEEQDVNLQIFLTLTDQDLKEIGIKKMGPRRKMTSTIARWHSNIPLKDNLEGAYANKLLREIQQLAEKLDKCNEECRFEKAKATQERNLRVTSEGWVVEARRRLQTCHQLNDELRNQIDHVTRSLVVSPQSLDLRANFEYLLINIRTYLEKFRDVTDPSIPKLPIDSASTWNKSECITDGLTLNAYNQTFMPMSPSSRKY